MKIEILNNYLTDENCYLVYNNSSCIVIDPGISLDLIIKKANELNVSIEYVFITHCHYDHIEYLEDLREKTGAKLVTSKNCADNIKNVNINLSAAALGKSIISKDAEIILNDNEKRSFCGMDVLCLYTPGHTNCGVCYVIENSVFVGDTLFLRNVGRCDLPTGDGNVLYKSIKEKLYTLDDDYKVYCGHGNPTTIGYEKKFNFYVKG